MSIAELIMQGTNRASESTAWVGDSLAKLGQQVGAALAQREQQKQAQEMLPFLQQSMQESMALAGSGKTGEAYAKLMPFITDPSVANNPYVLPAIGAATKFIDEESNNFLKKEQLRIQEGMYGARSDYQNSLLSLRENQATAKAELDAKKLGIQEQRLDLQRKLYETQDENEKARIDIQLQRLDLDEERLDSSNYFQQQKLNAAQDTSFQQSYEGAAGIGGTRNVGTPLTPTDRAAIEQAAKNIVNLEPLPDEVPQNPSGLPAMETKPFTMESDAATFAQLGEKPYQPSEQVLQEFQKNVAKYDSASSKEKKQMNSERSIVYYNLDELKNDLPSFNTDQIEFTQVNAGVVDPELFGIKYLRNVEKSRNAQGKITAYEKNTGAVKSIERLQTAFNIVNGRQDLRELYANAGGWQNVEIKSVPASKSGIQDVSASFEVINKKNREQKVLVTKEDADFLQSIEMVIPTSNTNKMDRIYLKGQQPTATEVPAPAEAPAPAQGGLPATQLAATSAVEIPAEAMELQKIIEQGKAAKAKETEKSVEKRIQDIDNEIKTLSSGTKISSAAPYSMTGAMGPFGMAAGSSVRARTKTPEEAQADIEKIAQLKSEKELLFVKTEKAYNTAKSEGRVFQSAEEARSSKKKFPAGTIIYIGREPAKVK